ncbi:MAG TPA: hypothetical protein PKY35_14150 [Candidatus Hydrogenedentes bacterium]|nr:hypothetical protein [Candidatus Hydrogenedentota bacterium]HOL78163.1 hypothetical protein [Candidatus Hydrogenedentota bacterium]HPO87250.1 hypothetical protein [Candidatus Hydrogenedentota bacterium]
MRYLRILGMVACVVSGNALAFCDETNNLLANPGFEEVSDESPAGWRVFVMPMDGAEGRLDPDTAFEGHYAAFLHNPKPYPKEPANNWSQHVLGDLADKELQLSGYIKTLNATEAAIWAQCCTKNPFQVLNAASTASKTPIRGTQDWTRVELRFKPPAKTEFITVRCVLKGEGKAWFDNICLADVKNLPKDMEPTRNPTEETKENDPSKGAENTTQPRTESLTAPPPKTNTTPQPSQNNMLDEIRELNLQLRDEINALREQIQLLEKQITETTRDKTTVPPTKNQQPTPPVPPLVPHGTTGELTTP